VRQKQVEETRPVIAYLVRYALDPKNVEPEMLFYYLDLLSKLSAYCEITANEFTVKLPIVREQFKEIAGKLCENGCNDLVVKLLANGIPYEDVFKVAEAALDPNKTP
jgi:hypothetical protein